MAQPTARKKIKGTDMVLIAGPFDLTREDKIVLGKMIHLYQQAGTAFHIARKARRLFLWRDAKGFATGNTPEKAGKRKIVAGARGGYLPKIRKSEG